VFSSGDAKTWVSKHTGIKGIHDPKDIATKNYMRLENALPTSTIILKIPSLVTPLRSLANEPKNFPIERLLEK
jgi:hypothetical protein